MLTRGGQHVAVGTLGTFVVAMAILAGAASAEDGSLQQMRDDVRGVPSGSSAPSPVHQSRPERPRSSESGSTWSDDEGLGLDAVAAIGWMCVLGVSSPFWGPHASLNDSLDVPACFPRFPYDHGSGYLSFDEAKLAEDLADLEGQWFKPWPTRPRRWAARFDVEYAEEFDSLSRVGGHLLLSTSSRWELDTEMHYFEESLGGAGRDHLWLGDYNLSFRFAQSERVQFRTGLGVNWLRDETDTELGFNFTYGVDLFPCKPWVLSSSIDWGTLGSAELFRFRTTAGLIVHGVEVYTGYEYLDIDRTQVGALVGGVRIWF